MLKSIASQKLSLAARCGSLFIGTFMLFGIVELAGAPNNSIAAADRSKPNLDRSNVPTDLIAGDPGRAIMNTSGASEIALAKHLSKKGVKMHGAFWCGYCNKQKEMFGKQAFAKIKYIECDARGNKPQPQVCSRAGVTGFPTWKFPNGQTFGGLTSLSSLADASGYTGSRNFKN
jgi:hypothetical protein